VCVYIYIRQRQEAKAQDEGQEDQIKPLIKLNPIRQRQEAKGQEEGQERKEGECIICVIVL
jgi:hypothetical protein